MKLSVKKLILIFDLGDTFAVPLLSIDECAFSFKVQTDCRQSGQNFDNAWCFSTSCDLIIHDGLYFFLFVFLFNKYYFFVCDQLVYGSTPNVMLLLYFIFTVSRMF